MTEVKKAAFSFSNFKVPSFSYQESENQETELKLSFSPSGKYYSEKGIFELSLKLQGIDEKTDSKIIQVNSVASFKFSEQLPFEKIPDYFYVNSIAILFPYLRSFVSTLTLQANTGIIMLDLMNLTSLKEALKENSITQ